MKPSNSLQLSCPIVVACDRIFPVRIIVILPQRCPKCFETSRGREPDPHLALSKLASPSLRLGLGSKLPKPRSGEHIFSSRVQTSRREDEDEEKTDAPPFLTGQSIHKPPSIYNFSSPPTANESPTALRKPLSQLRTTVGRLMMKSAEQKPKMYMAYTISEDVSGNHIKRILSRIMEMKRRSVLVRLRLAGFQSRRSQQRLLPAPIPTVIDGITQKGGPELSVDNSAQALNSSGGAESLTEEQISELKEALSLFDADADGAAPFSDP